MADDSEIIIGDFKIARSVLEKMVKESVDALPEVSQIRDVNVGTKDHDLVVDLNLSIKAKAVYPKTAKTVQEAVAKDINRMTSAEVIEVNVTIEKLDFKEGLG